MYTLEFVMLIVSAVTAYKVADFEDARPVLWTGVSVAAYLVTWLYLGWPWYGCMLGQLGLVGAVAVVRVLRARGGG